MTALSPPFAATSVALTLALTGVAGVAHAADDERGFDPATIATTGGDVSSPGDEMPASEKERAALKLAMAEAYEAATFGASPRRLARATRAFRSSGHLPRSEARAIVQLGAAASCHALTGEGVRAKVATSQRLLATTQVEEKEPYYCGPATGVMMMATLGAPTSLYNDVTLNQGHMAGPAHMRTEANGVTAWASRLFIVGINRWSEGLDDGWYVQSDSPTASTFQSALAVDIDSGHPFAADTVEFTGAHPHYNNHPDHGYDIGHWIDVFGYSGSGATSHFADPATYSANVQPKFTASSTSFVNTYLQTNGIAW